MHSVEGTLTTPTLEEQREHLHLMFRRLQELNVALEPKKFFIEFPSIRLLGKRVDGLGMTAAEAGSLAEPRVPRDT